MEINKNGLNRKIPPETKLLVRQHCGFGCVICGSWICEYEHFDPEFKDASNHDANGIALLCGTHHEAKTKGLITNEQIRSYWNNPYNINHGIRNNELFYSTMPRVFLCGNEIVDGGALYANLKFTSPFKDMNKSTGVSSLKNELRIKIIEIGNPKPNEPIPLLFNFYDSIEHLNPILIIDNNEWHGDVNNFDIESIGKKLVIRKKKGKILIDIDFDTKENTINIGNIDITLPAINIHRYRDIKNNEYGINLNGLKVLNSRVEGKVTLIGLLKNSPGQFETISE